MSDDGSDPGFTASFEELPLELACRVLNSIDTPLSALRFSLTSRKLYQGFTGAVWKRWLLKHCDKDVEAGQARQAVIEELASRCTGCEEEEQPLVHVGFWKANLCDDCAGSDEYRFATKTEAKKDFKLNDKELAPLRCITKSNPRYRSAAPMRLYAVRHLQAAAAEKFAKKNTTLDAAKASAAKSPARADPKIKRKANLEAALQEKGLELRYDSQMCSAYIKTGRGMKIPELVELMMRMHLIHEHSVYQQIRDRNYNRMRSDADLENGPPECYGGRYERDEYYERKHWFHRKFEDSKHRDEQAALGYIKQAEAIPHPDAATCACGRLLLKDYIEQHLFKD